MSAAVFVEFYQEWNVLLMFVFASNILIPSIIMELEAK